MAKSNSINDLSRVLGRLEADSGAAKNQRTEIFTQLGQIKSQLSCLPQLAKTVEAHSADISDFKRLKNKAAGVMLVLTFVGGAIGSAAVWAAKNFLSK
jgi:hypothetical protein